MRRKRAYQKENEVRRSVYFYILVFLILLMLIFLVLGNIYSIADFLARNYGLDLGVEQVKSVEWEEETNILANAPKNIGDSSYRVAIYGSGQYSNVMINQLQLMRIGVNRTSLSELDKYRVAIIDKSRITEEEAEELTRLNKEGLHLLFTQIPEEAESSQTMKTLLGVQEIKDVQTWYGIRVSGDLVSGETISEANYEVSGHEIVSEPFNKTYVAALPEDFADYANEDLPMLMWRRQEKGGGAVYVCNGDYMEHALIYSVMPMVLSELRGGVIYPVVNANCVIVEGAPFAGNEERENLSRLYDRTTFTFQQDLLLPELKRVSSVFGKKVSYFTDDYESFELSENDALSHIRRDILSEGGMLYPKEESELLQIPANYTADWLMGSGMHLSDMTAAVDAFGIYTIRINADNLLSYDGETDIWSAYCQNLDAIVGSYNERYWYLDSVTAHEAGSRMSDMLSNEIQAVYTEEGISLHTEAASGSFIVRSTHRDIRADNAAVMKISPGCWFVKVTDNNVEITWED